MHAPAADMNPEERRARVMAGKRVSALVIVATFALNGCSGAPAPTKPPSAPELKQTAITCMQSRDFSCAENAWSEYVKLRPNDSQAIANYGFVLNWEDKDQAAISQFKRAIGQGEGTYDLFAGYADSLANVGRTDDAIDWSYKTLQLVPSLVDVRGKLAKLLVQKKRYYEALTLLAEFDQHLEADGHPPYFKGQRISIESIAPRGGSGVPAESTHLKLVKFGNQFFAPVKVGESRVAAFLVDTGATQVALSDDFLVSSKAKYTIVRAHTRAKTADGRIVDAKLVTIDHLEIGNFELDRVPAIACGTCSLLLGEDALSHFDMASTQVQGVDVLTLTSRKAIFSP